MGITDFFTDVWETFSHPSADADGQPPVQGGTSTQSPASGTDEESGEEAEVNKQDAKSGGDSGEQGHKPTGQMKGDDEDEEPEEEEEEEETPDPKEQLEKGELFQDPQMAGPLLERPIVSLERNGLVRTYR
jgi:ubiquinol-cytochrome c reductase subunit 6